MCTLRPHRHIYISCLTRVSGQYALQAGKSIGPLTTACDRLFSCRVWQFGIGAAISDNLTIPLVRGFLVPAIVLP